MQDITQEQLEALPSNVTELQKRVLKSEATLSQKEEENAALREQLQQFEARWSEYDAKMKSMEDVWQKQMASLQVSFHVKLLYGQNVDKNTNILTMDNYNREFVYTR